jgi:hypothetical protein
VSDIVLRSRKRKFVDVGEIRLRRFWGVNIENPGWNVLINAVKGGIDKEYVAFRSRLIKIQQDKFLFFAFQRFRIEIEEDKREYREEIR